MLETIYCRQERKCRLFDAYIKVVNNVQGMVQIYLNSGV